MQNLGLAQAGRLEVCTLTRPPGVPDVQSGQGALLWRTELNAFVRPRQGGSEQPCPPVPSAPTAVERSKPSMAPALGSVLPFRGGPTMAAEIPRS